MGKEIKICDSTITDTMDKISIKNDDIYCCGKGIKMVSHVDGAEFYSTEWQCECGNSICVTEKRKENYLFYE